VAINLAAVAAALRPFSCLPRIGNRAPRFFQALEKWWLSEPTRRRVLRVGPVPGREMVLGSRGWAFRPPKRRRKPFRTFQSPESCALPGSPPTALLADHSGLSKVRNVGCGLCSGVAGSPAAGGTAGGSGRAENDSVSDF
jgi:hypothetical protein